MPARFKMQERWTDYDLTLIESGAGTVSARASDHSASLPVRGGGTTGLPTSAGLIRQTHPGRTDVAAEVSTDQVRYRGALGGRDVVQQLTTNGFKETVIVPNAASGNSYRAAFTLPSGITARNGGTGVEFVKDGQVVADFGGGEAWDANPVANPADRARVATTLVGQKNNVATVMVSVPSAWFSSASRVWPVTIDPIASTYTNSYYTGGDDSWAWSTEPTTGTVSRPLELYTGRNGSVTYRAVVKFPSSVLPYASNSNNPPIITSAFFRAYNFYSLTTTSKSIAVRGIANAVGTNIWSSSTYRWPVTNKPAVLSTPAPTAPTSFGNGSCCAGAWVSWDITPIAQTWVSATTTTAFNGVELSAADTNDTSTLRGFHGGSTGTNSAPVLHIDYMNRPNTPDQVAPANNAAVATPALSARYTHPQYNASQPSLTAGKVYFKIFDSNDVEQTTQSNFGNNNTAVNSGAVVTYTPAGLVDGTYKWEAWSYSNEGLWSLATPTRQSLILDTLAPLAPYSANSGSHNRSFPMSDRTVDATWTVGKDERSGLAGYSWAFTNSDTTAADSTVDSTGLNATSASLADGTWWFHVRAIDLAGNGSTDTAYGPMIVNGSAIGLPLVPKQPRLDVRCSPGPGYHDPVNCDAPSDGRAAPFTGPDDYRRLYGYNGPYFSPLTSGSSVDVLAQTVATTTSPSGKWQARGLVRNQSGSAQTAVTVTASLFNADNVLLGVASGPLLVPTLRPHEPGPFSLSSEVTAATVDHVTWTVNVPVAGTVAHRTLIIDDLWSLPYGDREPIADTAVGTEAAGGPLPFIQRGIVTNKGTATVPNPTVIGVWLDSENRVIWSATTQLVARAGQALTQLAIDDLADYAFVISDPAIAPLLSNSSFVAWGIGN